MLLLQIFLLVLTLDHVMMEEEPMPPLFNIAHYNNTCKRNMEESIDSKHCGDLIDFCPLFHNIMLGAMTYACSGNVSTIQKMSDMNLLYKRKFDDVQNKTLTLVTSLLDIQHVLQVLIASRNLKDRFNTLGTLSLTSIELGSAARTGYDSKNALSKYLGIEKKILEAAKMYLSDAYALKRNIEENQLSGIFTSDFYQEKLHLNIIPYVIHKSKQKVLALEEALPVAQTIEVLRTSVFPTIMCTELLVGLVGNGLMVVIFLKYSIFRKPNYIMISNLWVINTFSLLINLPLVILTINHPWKWNLTVCGIFWFFRTLSQFVSTYSVVILSYQRFRLVYPYTGRKKLSDKMLGVIMTVLLWLFGIIISLPETMFSNIELDRCISSESSMPYIAYFRMMVVCLTPMCPLTLFPVLVTIRLKKQSASEKISCGVEKQPVHANVLESRVLVAMIVVLLVTYIPSTIYNLTKKQSVLFGVYSFKDMIQATITMNLMDFFSFLNSALNPLILLSLSEEFKKHFTSLFTCSRFYRVNQKLTSKPM